MAIIKVEAEFPEESNNVSNQRLIIMSDNPLRPGKKTISRIVDYIN